MVPAVATEDSVADVLRKAMRGLGISRSALIAAARVAAGDLDAALGGATVEAAIFHALATPLELAPKHLIALAVGDYHPETTPPEDGFAMFNSPFGDGLTVNNFLLWDPHTREAALFDTGTDAAAPLAAIREHGLLLRDIFLTHTHYDHVSALGAISRSPRVHLCAREPADGLPTGSAAILPFEPDAKFSVGGLTVLAIDASGHTSGQVAFFVSGLEVGGRGHPIVIAGDALFAGSMGGADSQNYRRQRFNTAQNILTLPGETLVAPGHGPLSTVAFEREHNPVFA